MLAHLGLDLIVGEVYVRSKMAGSADFKSIIHI